MNNQYKSSQKLLKELRSEWETHHIPQDIQKMYLEAFQSLSKPQLHQFLIQEISSYQKSSSLILLCLSSILAQNESISTIKALNHTLELTTNWIMIEEVIEECAEIFEAYRNLTMSLVENILKWKKQMKEELKSPGVDLFYTGKSYLESLRTLLDFLLESEFSQVFHFVQNDPFLVKCSKIVETSQNFFIFKNQCFLCISLEVYEKVTSIEQEIAMSRAFQVQKLANDFSVKKVPEPAEEKKLSPIRSKSNKHLVHKDRSSENRSSVKVNRRKKTDYKYIDQVLESQLNMVEESSPESEISDSPSHKKSIKQSRIKRQKNEPDSSEVSESFTSKEYKQTRMKRPKNEPEYSDANESFNPQEHKQARMKRLKNQADYSDVSESFNSREYRQNKSLRKLPPLQNPRARKEVMLSSSNEAKLEMLTPNRGKRIQLADHSLKIEEQETKNFVSVERMVEKMQTAEDVLNELIKVCLKREDLYSLAYAELNAAVEESKNLKKKESVLKVAEEIRDELIEFYLRCSNMEALVESTVYTYMENNRKVIKIAENMELSDHYLNAVINEYLASLNFEEIVEECITISVKSHQAAISVLTKIQNTTPKHLKPIRDSIIEDFISSFLKESLVPSTFSELQSDDEFENLTSAKILSDKFTDFLFDYTKVQILLYSEVKTGESSTSSKETSQEMVEIGSRSILIGALLQKNLDYFSSTGKNRLQTDLIDLLQIYSALSETERPLLSNKFSISLELPYRPVRYQDSPYFLLRNISFKSSDSFTSFTIQSTLPKYSLFFISSAHLLQELHSELAFQKSDLFSKVESILNYDIFTTNAKNVLAPFFKKHLTWKLSWLQGLQLNEATQISGCIESLYIHFSNHNIEQDPVPLPCHTLDPPFIFGTVYLGLIHNPLYSSLKIPLAVCLVNSNDVIRK